MQFTGEEFQDFCKTFSIEHITTLLYYLRSNRQTEQFVGMFKRALKKVSLEILNEKALQNYLRVYWVTPNPNTLSGMSSVELMFSRRVKLVFDML